MGTYKISVVIPFYKGEKYITQSVRSILSQPYQDIELILVNDGSPTGSEACEQLAESDSRIRYFHKQNEGIGATRNFGLLQAKGDFIAFLDQDDVWVADFLTEVTVASLSGDDIICFACYSTNANMTRGNRTRGNTAKIPGGGYRSCKVFLVASFCGFVSSAVLDREPYQLRNNTA